jgi:hypothetical protein
MKGWVNKAFKVTIKFAKTILYNRSLSGMSIRHRPIEHSVLSRLFANGYHC